MCVTQTHINSAINKWFLTLAWELLQYPMLGLHPRPITSEFEEEGGSHQYIFNALQVILTCSQGWEPLMVYFCPLGHSRSAVTTVYPSRIQIPSLLSSYSQDPTWFRTCPSCRMEKGKIHISLLLVAYWLKLSQMAREAGKDSLYSRWPWPNWKIQGFC